MSLTYRSNSDYKGEISRYKVLRIINDGVDDYLETYNQVEIPESEDDQYHVVTAQEINRLDIISNNFYGSPKFYWAIALANEFIDPFVVEEGIMLRIPAFVRLYDHKLRILER